MVKKMAVIFVVGLFIMFIFGGGALAATAKKSSKATWSRPIAGEYNVDGAGYDLLPIPTKYPVKYSLGGSQIVTCDDIAPAVGSIVEHITVGDTWYDFQKNGSIGRMISVTNDGYRHFSWMYTDHEYPPGPRYVDANCVDPTVTDWIGQTHADGGDVNAGYSNQTHLSDGTSLIIHHRTAGTPIWYSTLTVDDEVCGGYFSNHYDLPDAIVNSPSGEDMMWPKAEVMWAYDGVNGPPDSTDYIHIVGTEGETAGGVPVMVAYERCYFGTDDTLICQAYVGNQTETYKLPKNEDGGGIFSTITHFDSSCSITPVVVVSPVSKRVAIAFLKPAGDGSCDYMGDPSYIESMNNGNDWIDGTNWPPPEFNITNFGMTGTERGLRDLSACYDYEDSLHIIYATYGFDPQQPGYYQPGVSRLYHWSKKDGVGMIADAIWGGTDAGAHMANIAKMSVSAKDPIYHPGGAEDSVYLYAIWSQFDTSDNAANALTNSEIYGCGSNDGGNTWGRPFNLTNTHTPGCSWPNCVSENWASMAQNMYDGRLHIQYICDLEPGGAIQDPSTWGAVPVYYLDLDEWEVIAECRTGYNIISPAQWHSPPLKVTPGSFRTLDFKVENIGNDDCTFGVTSSDPCIQVSAGGALAPGEDAQVSVTVDGAGACEGTFIDGNVILTSSEGGGKTDYLPVQVVVAEDYYECPRDPETVDTLENDYMQFYTNASCQEWMFDISTFQSAIGEDTTIEVFFQGGTIVATTSGNDTLVGRYMGQNDQHAGAQEKLSLADCGDYWLLYTSRIFMHNLNPPAHDFTWYWWELSKEIVFFKPIASEALQHCAIKYVTVERRDPPTWWPDQTPFTNYEDTYIGVAMDIDCPFDSSGSETGDENGCNLGRYDDVNHIAYQIGFGREHPAYNNYYAGIAMINGGGGPSGEGEAYKTHCMRNNQYLYPQSPWGWKDGELYELASDISGGRHQIDFGPDDPDSIVDRTYVVTAQKINAGNDPDARASFIMVEAVAPTGGRGQLQNYVATARAWVGVLPAICGDVNTDPEGIVALGDVVYLINYLYRAGPPPKPPMNRGDVNSDGVVALGDVVYLINYLYRAGPLPDCPGDWW